MAFENLSDRLQGAIQGVGKKGKITEADLKEMMREVRLALLEADVNFKVVKSFVKRVNERALDSEVLASLSPAQQVVKIVNEELTELLGGEQVGIDYASAGQPTVLMMVGLQGAGKTTTAGKLANYLRKEKDRKPLLVAGDIYRPAAINQLQTIGQQLDLPVFELGNQVDPVEISEKAIQYAQEKGYDTVFIDTAGRLQIDEKLMDELKNIKAAVNPNEILLTVDAMTGQEAANVAKAFDDELEITGVMLTKLDGDSRGGAALSIASITGKPIKFAGTGEKLEDIEIFYPDRMANRILGMGDMLTLIERAQKEFDEAEAEAMAAKMRENTFDFNDFMKQMEQMNKMGPLEDIIKMIPGLNQMPGLDQLKIDPKEMTRTKAIIQSMTNFERENPDEISQSRRKRIAKGSATTVAEVNRLIKQFNQSRDMMSKISNGNLGGLDKLMGGMGQAGGGKRNKMQEVASRRMMRKLNKKLGKKKRR
ncbi:signal recognition particle protein [Aerococcus sanguinicola]|uniref:signal recognition particle protein n=1 Tax=unclassified Aerococcus TaxID=2618060 RepID=UPI0008A123C7|nr:MULTISPECIES: signal recognition particle protein [unclassified Aerococcus]KAB0647690.1 signal recognition particle protein [Aerococcus sanguinicola]MDK6855365.1 signal recognition particle protein [Aerococcus sp. UMB7533]OFN05162.1 signal recognition particle protein [Aerococcus sp. HMSC062A02]OHO43748.1 signal recognition particle protein [Aerococcus sp. HMSC035B07]